MSAFLPLPLSAATILLLGTLACEATEGALLRVRDAGETPAAGEGAAFAGGGAGGQGGATAGEAAPNAPNTMDAGMAAPTAGASSVMEPRRDTRVSPGMRLHYQVTGERTLDAEADVFVLDLFETSAAEIAMLHARNRVVIAYLSAGTFEPWRPDASELPASVRGARLTSYPNESWLDVRSTEVRAVMKARLQRAKDKGFDGVFPGALGAYRRESGFPLTEGDQLDFDRFLSTEARALGLTPGLSGDFELAEQLAGAFDWAIATGCLAAMSCERLRPLIERDLAVFNLETEGELTEVCAEARALGIVTVLKHPSYDAWSRACP